MKRGLFPGLAGKALTNQLSSILENQITYTHLLFYLAITVPVAFAYIMNTFGWFIQKHLKPFVCYTAGRTQLGQVCCKFKPSVLLHRTSRGGGSFE